MLAEHDIADRYRVLRSQVRRRVGATPVVLREYFCPGCASALAVDVTLQGSDPAPTARLGVADPFSADPFPAGV